MLSGQGVLPALRRFQRAREGISNLEECGRERPPPPWPAGQWTRAPQFLLLPPENTGVLTPYTGPASAVAERRELRPRGQLPGPSVVGRVGVLLSKESGDGLAVGLTIGRPVEGSGRARRAYASKASASMPNPERHLCHRPSPTELRTVPARPSVRYS